MTVHIFGGIERGIPQLSVHREVVHDVLIVSGQSLDLSLLVLGTDLARPLLDEVLGLGGIPHILGDDSLVDELSACLVIVELVLVGGYVGIPSVILSIVSEFLESAHDGIGIEFGIVGIAVLIEEPVEELVGDVSLLVQSRLHTERDVLLRTLVPLVVQPSYDGLEV